MKLDEMKRKKNESALVEVIFFHFICILFHLKH